MNDTQISIYFPSDWTERECRIWLDRTYDDYATYESIWNCFVGVVDRERLDWIKAHATV